MLKVRPIIDPQIFQIAPNFRAMSISVEASNIVNLSVASECLNKAYKSVQSGDNSWIEKHLLAWNEAFKKFGAKPQRTPCSAEALRKRFLRDGCLPSIDPIVDLYNAISLQFGVPIGGENFSAYTGIPRLTVAKGDELFDTMKDGQLVHETVDAGEVIWRDDIGVTCRRWNWRQGVRTRLDSTARQMWFILESLAEMPEESLYEASEELTSVLKIMMPDAQVDQTFVSDMM